jgi:hypothetical protein
MSELTTFLSALSLDRLASVFSEEELSLTLLRWMAHNDDFMGSMAELGVDVVDAVQLQQALCAGAVTAALAVVAATPPPQRAHSPPPVTIRSRTQINHVGPLGGGSKKPATSSALLAYQRRQQRDPGVLDRPNPHAPGILDVVNTGTVDPTRGRQPRQGHESEGSAQPMPDSKYASNPQGKFSLREGDVC